MSGGHESPRAQELVSANFMRLPWGQHAPGPPLICPEVFERGLGVTLSHLQTLQKQLGTTNRAQQAGGMRISHWHQSCGGCHEIPGTRRGISLSIIKLSS